MNSISTPLFDSLMQKLESLVYYPSKYDLDLETKEVVQSEEYALVTHRRKNITIVDVSKDKTLPIERVKKEMEEAVPVDIQFLREIGNTSLGIEDIDSHYSLQATLRAKIITKLCNQIVGNKDSLPNNTEKLFHLRSLLVFYDLLLSYNRNQLGIDKKNPGKYLVALIAVVDEKCRALLKNSPLTLAFSRIQQVSQKNTYTLDDLKLAHRTLGMLYYEKVLYDLYKPYNKHALFCFVQDQKLVNPVQGDLIYKDGSFGLQESNIIFEANMGLGLLIFSCLKKYVLTDNRTPHKILAEYLINLNNFSIQQRIDLHTVLTELYEKKEYGDERVENKSIQRAVKILLSQLEAMNLKNQEPQFLQQEKKIAALFLKLSQNMATFQEVFPEDLSCIPHLYSWEVEYPLIILARESSPGDTSKVDQNSNYYAEFHSKAEAQLAFYESTLETRQKMYRVAYDILFDNEKKPPVAKNASNSVKFQHITLRNIPFSDTNERFPSPDQLYGLEPKKKEEKIPAVDTSSIASSSKEGKEKAKASKPRPSPELLPSHELQKAEESSQALEGIPSSSKEGKEKKPSLPDVKPEAAPAEVADKTLEDSAASVSISPPAPKEEYSFEYSERIISQFEWDRENGLLSHAVPFSVDPYAFAYGIETTRKNRTYPGYMDRHWTVPVEIVQDGRSKRCKMTIAVSGKDNMVYHRCLESKTTQEFLAEFFQEGDDLADFPPLTAETQQKKLPRPEKRGTTDVKQTNFYTKEITDPDFGILRIFDYKKLKALNQSAQS